MKEKICTKKRKEKIHDRDITVDKNRTLYGILHPSLHGCVEDQSGSDRQGKAVSDAGGSTGVLCGGADLSESNVSFGDTYDQFYRGCGSVYQPDEPAEISGLYSECADGGRIFTG